MFNSEAILTNLYHSTRQKITFRITTSQKEDLNSKPTVSMFILYVTMLFMSKPKDFFVLYNTVKQLQHQHSAIKTNYDLKKNS